MPYTLFRISPGEISLVFQILCVPDLSRLAWAGTDSVLRVFVMKPHVIKHVLFETYNGVTRNHTLQMSAALSYYVVLSLFPAMIFFSAMIAYLPIPDLFNQASALMADLLPAESMGLVGKVLADVITPNRGAFLSFGILATLWASSGVFAAAIEALNMAYEVSDDRPFWKTRGLALGLAFTIEFLALVALFVLVVGPRFGEWLAHRIRLSEVFVLLWPYLRWSIAIAFAVLAVEVLYFFAPNVKQRFQATLPGAVAAVTCWICLSYVLGQYFRHFAKFNKTYGTMGAAIGLMIWLYWTAFAVLVGAALNAELAKLSGKPSQQQDQTTNTKIHVVA